MEFGVVEKRELLQHMDTNSRNRYRKLGIRNNSNSYYKSWRKRICETTLTSMAFYLQIDLFRWEKVRLNANHKDGRLYKLYRFALNSLLLLSTIQVLLVAWYQIIYNCHLYQYRIMSKNLSMEPSFRSSRMIALQTMIENDISKLEFFGAPHMNLNTIACSYYVLTVILFSAYFQTNIFYRCIQPLNFSFLRMIVDEQKEQFNLNSVIVQEIDKLIQSSSNFMRKVFYNFEPDAQQSKQEHDQQQLDNNNNNNNDSQVEVSSDHLEMIYLLKQMALAGQLQPRNRLSNWMNKLALMMQTIMIVFPTFCVCFLYFTLIYLPSVYTANLISLWTKRDLLVLAQVFLLSFSILTEATFNLVLVVMSALDQIYGIIELIKTIKQCLHLNRQRFIYIELDNLRHHEHNFRQNMEFKKWKQMERRRRKAISVSSNTKSNQNLIEILIANNNKSISSNENKFLRNFNSSNGRLRTLMNADLLYVLTHYKILINQMKPLQPQHGFIASICIQYIFFMPATFLLATPSMETLRTWVPLLLGASILFLLWADICFLSLCYIHSRSHDIYKALASLMAHSIKLDSRMTGQEIYYDQTVALLYRELSDPRHLIDQFAARSFGLRLTYTTIIKIHFWLGLMYIYMYHLPNSQDDWTKSFNFF